MLLQSPLSQAHALWAEHFKENSIAIDATCGNGHDSLFIALGLVQGKGGTLYSLDVQKQAVENTQRLIKENLRDLSRVHILLQSHETFPISSPIELIVYNLGYLPGGDKSITTLTSTTLLSLENACKVLSPTGLISITCYPGHTEGFLESESIRSWAQKLDKSQWLVIQNQWLNRKKAPFNIFLKKIL